MSSIVRKATKEESLRLEKAYNALHKAAVEVCAKEELSAGELITTLLDLLVRMCDVADVDTADLIKLINKTTEFRLPDTDTPPPYGFN